MKYITSLACYTAGKPSTYPSSLPLSSVHQLLSLLFGDNGKEARHNAAVVPGNGVKKATRPASAMVTVFHLRKCARWGGGGVHMGINKTCEVKKRRGATDRLESLNLILND